MRVGKRRRCLTLCVLIAGPGLLGVLSAHAQGLCNKKMTRQECENAYAAQLTPRAASLQQEGDKVRQTVEQNASAAKVESGQANTGSANASSTLPTSAFTDFFNLLQSSATTGSTDAKNPEALAFELNECGVPIVADRGVSCQIRARAQRPKLYDPLKKALESAGLSDRATDLGDKLDVTDQVTVGAFFSLVGDWWGCGFSWGSVSLYSELKSEANAAAAAAAGVSDVGALSRDITQFIMDLGKDRADTAIWGPNVSNAALTFEEIFPPDLVDKVVARYEEYAEKNVAFTKARYDALVALGASELANLINQQPQLYFGVEYGAVSQFVGPDEIRAKIAYETGFANVNRYRAFARRSCAAGDANAGLPVSLCLKKYVDQPGVRAALKSGTRLAVTIEHVRRKRFDVAVPDSPVALSVAPTRSWIGSLALGRYLDMVAQEQKTRLDIVASYEDVSDDPKRRDRGIASATVSRQLSGDWVLAVGVVYATKPEFRAQADKDVSLRLGLNYKLLRKPPG